MDYSTCTASTNVWISAPIYVHMNASRTHTYAASAFKGLPTNCGMRPHSHVTAQGCPLSIEGSPKGNPLQEGAGALLWSLKIRRKRKPSEVERYLITLSLSVSHAAEILGLTESSAQCIILSKREILCHK